MSEVKTTNFYLKNGEALDDLGQGLCVIQHKDYYRFTSDAVALFHFVNVKRGESVCEFGAGCGVISILLAAKFAHNSFTAIEIQPCLFDLAKRSVELNGLSERVEVLNGDVRESGLERSSFSVVVCNPPYRELGSGDVSLHPSVALARHEINLTLKEMIEAADYHLKFSGRLYFVHQSQRLGDIFRECHRYGFEVKVIAPLKKTKGKIVLIEAVKGGKSGTILKEPM